MINFIFALWLVVIFIGPIAIWSSWNETNANNWIAENVKGCPFKYKWQIANDLSMKNKSAKFSYLLTLPKAEVIDLWLEANGCIDAGP